MVAAAPTVIPQGNTWRGNFEKVSDYFHHLLILAAPVDKSSIRTSHGKETHCIFHIIFLSSTKPFCRTHGDEVMYLFVAV